MTVALRNPIQVEQRDQYNVFDDFFYFVSTDTWTSILTDSGTAAVTDAVKGVLALAASDGTVADNDQTLIKGTTEIFKFADGKPMFAEALIQFTEANTDDANVGFGVANAVAADLLRDDGAGPKTSGSFLMIYKVDGSNVWKVASSCNATQTISTSTATAGGSSYQRLRIEYMPLSSILAEAHFFVDGIQLLDSSTLKPIVHRFDHSDSPTEMQLFATVKNGGGNLETLNIDYIAAAQKR